MAVPFYIPENESSGDAAASSTQTTPAGTPSRPIPIPLRHEQQQSPQQSPIDNEVLVQAFYEALCRCSQGSPMSAPMSPSSPFNHGQFFFPRHMMSTPSTSAHSSPRHSFRVPRRRLDSHGSYTQQDSDAEDEEETHRELIDWENHYQQREQMEEFSGRVPQPKRKKSKTSESNQKSSDKPKSESAQSKSKITSFVISALQYVIDTLR